MSIRGEVQFPVEKKSFKLSGLTTGLLDPMYEKMSEDRGPYKRVGQAEETSELNHLMRAVRVERWLP